MKNEVLEALVRNYGFKKAEFQRLPTIDYAYPDYVANGNNEEFRFSPELRYELAQRKGEVTKDLENKSIVWTYDEGTLREIGNIAPRLGLKELIDGEINSIYSFAAPILFVGMEGEALTAYVVKAIPDNRMAWFELTPSEKEEVKNLIKQKAKEKPAKGLVQKLKGLFTK